MIKFDTINNKIIQNSVVQYSAPVSNPVNSTSKSSEEVKPKEKKVNTNAILLGASAVAASVIAGIMIYRGRGNKVSSSKPLINHNNNNEENILELLKKNEKLRFNAETIIREKIFNKFTEVFEGPIDTDSYKKLIQRIVDVTGSKEQKSYDFMGEIFSLEEAKAVMAFHKKYEYNYLLRAGEINPDSVEEIKILDKIIESSAPLKEETTVYRGVRTKEFFGDFKELDFAKKLKVGEIIEDKAFASTSRVYSDELAKVDPELLDDIQNAGYIVRIKVPAGYKGLDMRGFTGVESDMGMNSIFVLPRNSKLKISAIDEKQKIIDAEAIL